MQLTVIRVYVYMFLTCQWVSQLVCLHSFLVATWPKDSIVWWRSNRGTIIIIFLVAAWPREYYYSVFKGAKSPTQPFTTHSQVSPRSHKCAQEGDQLMCSRRRSPRATIQSSGVVSSIVADPIPLLLPVKLQARVHSSLSFMTLHCKSSLPNGWLITWPGHCVLDKANGHAHWSTGQPVVFRVFTWYHSWFRILSDRLFMSKTFWELQPTPCHQLDGRELRNRAWIGSDMLQQYGIDSNQMFTAAPPSFQWDSELIIKIKWSHTTLHTLNSRPVLLSVSFSLHLQGTYIISIIITMLVNVRLRRLNWTNCSVVDRLNLWLKLSFTRTLMKMNLFIAIIILVTSSSSCSKNIK